MSITPITQRYLRLHLIGAFILVFAMVTFSNGATLMLRRHVEAKTRVAKLIETVGIALLETELGVRALVDVRNAWAAESSRTDIRRSISKLSAARKGLADAAREGLLSEAAQAMLVHPVIRPIERMNELEAVAAPLLDREGTFGAQARRRLRVTIDITRAVLPALERMRAEEREALAGAISRLTLAGYAATALTGAILVAVLAFIFRPLEQRVLGAQQTILAKTEAAEAAAEAKSRFLATISHEIRTPMNGVLGMADILRRTRLDDNQRQMVEVIADSGAALVTIIDEILDFSKIEAEGPTLEEQPFDVRACITDAVALFQALAVRKGLSITHRLTTSVASRHLGDGVRLRQILVNLLSNAVKFTPSGGIEVVVADLGPANGFQRLAISVSDTGIGIPQAAQEAVFHPFHQLDSTATRAFGGTGLGLAIVRRLVDAMGGQIYVESAPGQGTTFTVELFLRPAVAPAAAPGPNRAAPPVGAGSGLRVLVAEDDEINRLVVAAMLRELACEAEFVADGEEALLRIFETQFDLVLMDVSMPRRNGYETVTAVRAEEARRGLSPCPIIGLSAHALDEHRETARAVGMTDFLTKPVTFATLRDVVNAQARHAGGNLGRTADLTEPEATT